MIVADSNLVVYLTVPEGRAAAARAVRLRDREWVAPPLWASEVRNVLVTLVRVGRLAPDGAREAWAVARDLVRDVDVDPLAVLDAAFAYGLSGYDAEFVALAHVLGVPLVTDDKAVLRACPGTAVSLDAFAADAPTDTPDAPGR